MKLYALEGDWGNGLQLVGIKTTPEEIANLLHEINADFHPDDVEDVRIVEFDTEDDLAIEIRKIGWGEHARVIRED